MVAHKLNLVFICFTGLAKWFLHIIFCIYSLYFPIFNNHINSEFFFFFGFSLKIRKSAALDFHSNMITTSWNWTKLPLWMGRALTILSQSSSFPATTDEYHCCLPWCFHSCFAYADSVYRQEESEIFFGPLSLSKAGKQMTDQKGHS